MRVLLIVAYDGSNYSGFARNNNVPTIEGALNDAIGRLTGQPVEVIGASRTDAGVHALCNVAVFDNYSSIPADRFAAALNTKLPDDIRITRSYEVEPDFHPRRRDVRKIYEYRILNTPVELPTERLYSWHIGKGLDTDLMNKAARHLTGRHDFSSFCSSNGNHMQDKTRTVHHIDVSRNADIVKIKVIGDGFLYNMVRIIAGTLAEAGMGRLKPEAIVEILQARDRRAAARTAPPQGLTLARIEYL